MSIKSERVKSLIFGKPSALYDAYMAGRYLEAREISMGRARREDSIRMRQCFVKAARQDHHNFLRRIAKIKQLECA